MPTPVADELAPVLVGGAWRPANANAGFAAANPASGRELDRYPVSTWADIDAALSAGAECQSTVASDPDRIARFLEVLADAIAADTDRLVRQAHSETALPSHPRLAEVELPRTVDQLRQAGGAARGRSWMEPTISTPVNIASLLAPMPGVVVVMGPNNFPFAFNGISGGDFAAAIGSGHPVLAKANRGHPGTTRLLAEHARAAAAAVGLPASIVQLVYALAHEDGSRLVSDPRVAATAFTGSQRAGLELKGAADHAGRPIYLEMSSLNPVVLLEGALREDTGRVAEELAGSMLLGTGQFCTSPGLIFVPHSGARTFFDALRNAIDAMPAGTLLSKSVEKDLERAVGQLRTAGAKVVHESAETGQGAACPTRVLEVSAEVFLAESEALQTEAFGNAALLVTYPDIGSLTRCVARLQGSLTGTIYVARRGASDDGSYRAIESVLRRCVGRLLNNKPPTGVAVVPAMVHGGPYPSTGHPGFTAVGIPASFRRFAMLQCYDNVPAGRLPPELQPDNPLNLQRFVDGRWTSDPYEPIGEER